MFFMFVLSSRHPFCLHAYSLQLIRESGLEERRPLKMSGLNNSICGLRSRAVDQHRWRDVAAVVHCGFAVAPASYAATP